MYRKMTFQVNVNESLQHIQNPYTNVHAFLIFEIILYQYVQIMAFSVCLKNNDIKPLINSYFRQFAIYQIKFLSQISF